MGSKRNFPFFLDTFMSSEWLTTFAGLGLSTINPAEKDVNSLTQTVFYSSEMMSRQARAVASERDAGWSTTIGFDTADSCSGLRRCAVPS